MITLLIVRGLPGSGKTTFAKTVADEVFAADDFFTDVDGNYEWDGRRLGEAHKQCFENVGRALIKASQCCSPSSIIAVTNVFASKKDVVSYADLAKSINENAVPGELKVRLWVVDLFDQNMSDEALSKSNVHQVPVDRIASMRMKWEH